MNEKHHLYGNSQNYCSFTNKNLFRLNLNGMKFVFFLNDTQYGNLYFNGDGCSDGYGYNDGDGGPDESLL